MSYQWQPLLIINSVSLSIQIVGFCRCSLTTLGPPFLDDVNSFAGCSLILTYFEAEMINAL